MHNYAEAVRARILHDPETEIYMADEAELEWARFINIATVFNDR